MRLLYDRSPQISKKSLTPQPRHHQLCIHHHHHQPSILCGLVPFTMHSLCRCHCACNQQQLHKAGQQRCSVLAPTHQSAASSGAGHRRAQGQLCSALDPLIELAATDPAALQDVIVGGAVTAAVGAALYSGLKQEPVPCDLCAGNGGIKCFACSGGSSSGSTDLINPDILQAQAGKKLARGFTSSSSSRPGSCRVCKGKGLVLCSKCKGSGYVSTF